ncbi:sodium ion-translocating decarboxylase subunit beta [Desulfallas sp. Bu1-1]|uniref:sodium ion-translocating decarboxylase subunit beta n=1 Tax=Desulfallas sp. Bu1-1 TaxID=2787620 RepID=UPI00189F51C2|nr:sodium ion-translocating decarboxylase subunit beta [Desulfallas sp. Bu1-1]MBF7082937.1 sodium ion-translocating decarboxylase subunit beta [Desulfallas sp. Bu1-1]
MPDINFLNLFQGIATLFATDTLITVARIGLIVLGIALVYLGARNILEPLLMIPMGFGMASVNAAVLFLSGGKLGTIFIDPLVADPSQLMNILQVDFLQPIYTLTFSNGLIACFIFLGIGVMTEIGYVLASPFSSMVIAICAELGTVATFPIAVAMGLNYSEAASIAMVGGADGPMVLYTSLMLAKDLFVPITIVAYLYLSLTYGGYPYLIKLLIPKRLRGIQMDLSKIPTVTPGEKIAFSIITCTVLSLLFPVAAPLFMSFFLGVTIREANLKHYISFIEGPLLYGSTFFLGVLLGVLCEANTIMNPKILVLLVLGILSLFLSGLGGIAGGYLMYWINKGKFNPVIGIAGVSCIPTTAKVAQKAVTEANSQSLILPYAIGANISGVITSAILTGIYVTLIPVLK